MCNVAGRSIFTEVTHCACYKVNLLSLQYSIFVQAYIIAGRKNNVRISISNSCINSNVLFCCHGNIIACIVVDRTLNVEITVGSYINNAFGSDAIDKHRAISFSIFRNSRADALQVNILSSSYADSFIGVIIIRIFDTQLMLCRACASACFNGNSTVVAFVVDISLCSSIFFISTDNIAFSLKHDITLSRYADNLQCIVACLLKIYTLSTGSRNLTVIVDSQQLISFTNAASAGLQQQILTADSRTLAIMQVINAVITLQAYIAFCFNSVNVQRIISCVLTVCNVNIFRSINAKLAVSTRQLHSQRILRCNRRYTCILIPFYCRSRSINKLLQIGNSFADAFQLNYVNNIAIQTYTALGRINRNALANEVRCFRNVIAGIGARIDNAVLNCIEQLIFCPASACISQFTDMLLSSTRLQISVSIRITTIASLQILIAVIAAEGGFHIFIANLRSIIAVPGIIAHLASCIDLSIRTAFTFILQGSISCFTGIICFKCLLIVCFCFISCFLRNILIISIINRLILIILEFLSQSIIRSLGIFIRFIGCFFSIGKLVILIVSIKVFILLEFISNLLLIFIYILLLLSSIASLAGNQSQILPLLNQSVRIAAVNNLAIRQCVHYITFGNINCYITMLRLNLTYAHIAFSLGKINITLSVCIDACRQAVSCIHNLSTGFNLQGTVAANCAVDTAKINPLADDGGNVTALVNVAVRSEMNFIVAAIDNRTNQHIAGLAISTCHSDINIAALIISCRQVDSVTD